MTLQASERVLAMTESATPVAFCSYVAPILERMTIFLTGPLFFLSIFMISRSLSTVMSLAAGTRAIRGIVDGHGKVVCLETPGEATNSHLAQHAHLTGNLGLQYHSDTDTFSVKNGRGQNRLNGVTDGMAEVDEIA
jgi:hypothetical protein